MTVVEIDAVTKRYADIVALDGVSLSIPAGSTFGLLGTNGAGKTTLFRLLVGQQTPDAGTVTVAGLDPTSGTAVRQRVGYLPETAGFPATVTAREVLDFHAEVRGLAGTHREQRIEAVLETVGLGAAADRRVGGFSKGMNRRLGLATAILPDPSVLLLDEPTAGLDPQGVDTFIAIVEALADEDFTIVFSSHSLSDVERLCDRVAILADGQVRARGSVQSLRTDAAETVIVTATLDDPASRDSVAATLTEHPAVAAIQTTAPADIRFACECEAAADVVGILDDTGALERFEVREPDLGAAFRQAVDRDASATGSPTVVSASD